MKGIVDIINSKEDLIQGKGCSVNEVEAAEFELDLIFSEEYIEYLIGFGVAAFEGHELCGITEIDRLNIVAITKAERSRNVGIPDDFYVVEQTNIDGIVIWQSRAGIIYQTVFDSEPEKVFGSLAEYLEYQR